MWTLKYLIFSMKKKLDNFIRKIVHDSVKIKQYFRQWICHEKKNWNLDKELRNRQTNQIENTHAKKHIIFVGFEPKIKNVIEL